MKEINWFLYIHTNYNPPPCLVSMTRFTLKCCSVEKWRIFCCVTGKVLFLPDMTDTEEWKREVEKHDKIIKDLEKKYKKKCKALKVCFFGHFALWQSVIE